MAAKPLHPVYSLTPRPAGPPLRWRRLLLGWLVLLGLFGYLATLWHHPGDNLPLAGQIGVMALLFSPLLLTWWELRRWHRLAPPVPPEGAPVLAPPQRFRHRGHWLELRADGVLIAPATLMATSRSSEWRDAWAADMAAASARQSFVAWDEITAWECAATTTGRITTRCACARAGRSRCGAFGPTAGTRPTCWMPCAPSAACRCGCSTRCRRRNAAFRSRRHGCRHSGEGPCRGSQQPYAEDAKDSQRTQKTAFLKIRRLAPSQEWIHRRRRERFF